MIKKSVQFWINLNIIYIFFEFCREYYVHLRNYSSPNKCVEYLGFLDQFERFQTTVTQKKQLSNLSSYANIKYQKINLLQNLSIMNQLHMLAWNSVSNSYHKLKYKLLEKYYIIISGNISFSNNAFGSYNWN